MFRSQVLILMSLITFCFPAFGGQETNRGEIVGEFTEDSIEYKIYLSFKAKNGVKIFNNNTTRKIVFWDPQETTVELKAQEKNHKRHPNILKKAKEKLYISFGNKIDNKGQLFRIPATQFEREGIYTFSEQRSCH